MEARYDALDEEEPAERTLAPWTAGLNDADGPHKVLHLLWGAKPHPEWGGGLAWRCGSFPGACHIRTPEEHWRGRFKWLKHKFQTTPAKVHEASECF